MTEKERIIKTIHTASLRASGEATAFIDNKQHLVWGALPGETVEAVFIKKEKKDLIFVTEKVISSSPHRIPSKEVAFESSSPWQIFDFEYENRCKEEIAKEVYENIPEVLSLLQNTKIKIDNTLQYEYRQKMEYHFVEKDGKLSLGIFGRKERKKVATPPSLLAKKSLNNFALEVLSFLQEKNIPVETLKTLIVRTNRHKETIGGLFITDKKTFENLKTPFKNLSIFYSEPLSPASVITEVIHEAEINTLKEDLLGRNFAFGLMSFFQINPPIFEEALRDIETFVPKESTVVDFYSGVGTIGLSLVDKVSKVFLVEENESAVLYAKENIISQGAINAEAYQGDSRKLRDFIRSERVIIFDPPRGGLHPKIIHKCLEVVPPWIIYLSCNIETQARDTAMLLEKFEPVNIHLYNFFPRTPHLESLVVLKRKDL